MWLGTMCSVLYFFFFSSRRRHTRSSTVSWAREMCIRDRRGADAGHGVGLSGAGIHAHAGARAVAGAGQSNRCLLYTSDAADERSSVDLGGRRLIKKKKQQYIALT